MLEVMWELDRSRQVQARLAVAEERLRFARDLHDTLGRNLSVVALKSELAVQLARRRDTGAVAEMEEVREVAERSLKEVREVVRGYRAIDLDTELAGSQSVLRAAGVQCEVTGRGADLPPSVQAALAWVVREGTTNVLRHSEATRCVIAVRPAAGNVTLTMENDGVGSRRRTSGGTGLVGLSERLREAGGTLHGKDLAEGRYRLTAEVPVEVGATP
jgi:two-component system sensor histidine kinase DesK